MYEVKLNLAINENNNCVTIDEIKKNKSLKNNQYFCPNCNDKVIPRIGEINKAHFAHKNNLCDPIKARESGLHKLCKEILVNKKFISFGLSTLIRTTLYRTVL